MPEAEALVLSHRLDNTRTCTALEEGWIPVEGLQGVADGDAAVADPAFAAALAATRGGLAEHALEDLGVRGVVLQGPGEVGVEVVRAQVSDPEDPEVAEESPAQDVVGFGEGLGAGPEGGGQRWGSSCWLGHGTPVGVRGPMQGRASYSAAVHVAPPLQAVVAQQATALGDSRTPRST